MSTTAAQPVTTPIPVQLSEPEFEAFILPHLSMPKRGPKCKLGYYRVFNLILRMLYTGMQWKCLPVPQEPDHRIPQELVEHPAVVDDLIARFEQSALRADYDSWSTYSIVSPLHPGHPILGMPP